MDRDDSFGFGLYTQLTIQSGALHSYKRSGNSSISASFGVPIGSGAVVIAEGRHWLQDFPVEPGADRWLEPEEYQAYWEQYLRAFEAAGYPILFTNIGPELFASYPERRSEREKREAERRAFLKAEAEEQAKLEAFQASAVDKVANAKRPVLATIFSHRGGKKMHAGEAAIAFFKVGVCGGNDTVWADVKDKGSRHYDYRRVYARKALDDGARVRNPSWGTEGEPVVVLKGYGHKLPAEATWDDLRRYVEKNKPEVLLDWWPDDFTHETKGVAA